MPVISIDWRFEHESKALAAIDINPVNLTSSLNVSIRVFFWNLLDSEVIK